MLPEEWTLAVTELVVLVTHQVPTDVGSVIGVIVHAGGEL